MTRRLNLRPKMLVVAAGVSAALELVVVCKLDAQVAFEAASVKPISAATVLAGRKGGRGPGGPGTADPGRIHYAAIRLKVLL